MPRTGRPPASASEAPSRSSLMDALRDIDINTASYTEINNALFHKAVELADNGNAAALTVARDIAKEAKVAEIADSIQISIEHWSVKDAAPVTIVGDSPTRLSEIESANDTFERDEAKETLVPYLQ